MIMIWVNTIKLMFKVIFEFFSCRTKPTDETSSKETEPSEEPDSEYIYLRSRDIENVHLN
jgi:hypothetical protein